MSFLHTHRLHWGSSHPKLSGNLHEHLDLMIHQDSDSNTPAATDPSKASSIDAPTEMPSQIIHPPSTQRELGS